MHGRFWTDIPKGHQRPPSHGFRGLTVPVRHTVCPRYVNHMLIIPINNQERKIELKIKTEYILCEPKCPNLTFDGVFFTILFTGGGEVDSIHPPFVLLSWLARI